MSRKKTKLVNGELFYRTSTGVMINISDLVRIYKAVDVKIKPGMSEAEVDQLISATVKRMGPN